MAPAAHPFVVSGDWLETRLGQPGLAIVDGSWYLPAQNRDGRAEYLAAHIPGAQFFDQDRIVAAGSTLPHSLPSPQEFAEQVSALGIADTDRIVVYDGPGFFSAPRVWWMFRVMGVREVLLLDGGMDRWKAEGRPVASGEEPARKAVFTPRFDAGAVVGLDEMRAIVASGSAQIADARPTGRFAGETPEPRPGLRSGHMPGARNLPATELSRDGSLLPREELAGKFAEAGIDLSRPVVTSCGSGVTAAAISFALQALGHFDNRLYDGSWSEWGGRDDTPVASGEA